MRVLLQRVSRAAVRVDGRTVAEIGRGFLLLVGIGKDDGFGEYDRLAEKVFNLRVFEDEQGKMNRALAECGGSILAVSQFTLCGDARRGRRPSFDGAASIEDGRLLFDAFVRELREAGVHVETGIYQAHMAVELINDGPVTILLDSRKEF